MQRESDPVLQRELAYHEDLYSGFAQQHFAKPAVRAFRAHLIRHVLRKCRLNNNSKVLSLGCGIGDTELLLAPHVGEIVGVDLSPTAIGQARADSRGIRNIRFACSLVEDVAGIFDAVIAIFFLHHLSDEALAQLPAQIASRLRSGGVFYGIDPSRQRLSGWVGKRVCPKLMAKYQSDDERELDRLEVVKLFESNGFDCRSGFYDFVSTPLAGLLPSAAMPYKATRILDAALVAIPGLRLLGSNFEIVATKN